MNETVVDALNFLGSKFIAPAVTAATTVFITAFATNWLATRRRNTGKLRIDSEIQKAISGHWSGTAHQDEGPSMAPVYFPITFELRTTGRSISGTAKICTTLEDDEIRANLILEGGLYKERFLRLDFQNSDPAYNHFGAFMLKLEDVPNKLSGRYSAYGAYSKKIIGGKISLEKQ